MLAILLASLSLGSDSISLARADLASKVDAMFMTVNSEQVLPEDALSEPKSSYVKFFQDAGKHPLRFACAADIDGDHVDEMVVVRETKPGGKLTLQVIELPTTSGQKAPQSIASFGSGMPNQKADGKLVALGRLDLDEDSKDELVFVRSFLDGHQEIEVVAPPAMKKAAVGAPLLRIIDAGDLLTSRVVEAFGVAQHDGVPARLALVSVDPSGATRLSTYAIPPQGVLSLPPAATSFVLSIAGVPVEDAAPQGENGRDPGGVVVLRRAGPTTQRVDFVSPSGTSTAHETIVTGSAPIRHCDAVRQLLPPPPPLADFTVAHSVSGGDVIHVHSTDIGLVVPIPNATGWSIPLPNSPSTLLQLDTSGALSPAAFTILFSDPTAGEQFQADIFIPGGQLSPTLGGPGTTGYAMSFFPNQGVVGTLTNLSTGSTQTLESFRITIFEL